VNTSSESVEKVFSEAGGEFITPASQIAEKLKNIKVYLFDWDGVFNAGVKGEGTHSAYAEPDSMGTNLLRFGHWLKSDELPLFGIITGQNNKSAFELSRREHFQFVYYSLPNKIEAVNHIESIYEITRDRIAFVFDDALDLSIAAACGLRFLVRRTASPLFERYVRENHLCDYICAHVGDEYAVREVCELILGLAGVYSEALDERIKFSDKYSTYLSKRISGSTSCYTMSNGAIIEKNIFWKKGNHENIGY